MSRRILVTALALLLISVLPTAAHATPTGQAMSCSGPNMDSTAMSGMYLADEYRLRVDIGFCGGITVLWGNASGTHRAGYTSVEAMPGGGFLARVTSPDPVARSLDNRNVIGVKPAERGWIQVITMSAFGDEVRVYRLRKIS